MKKIQLKQRFEHYEKWEDYQQGMYKTICQNETKKFNKCKELFITPYLLEMFMQKVVKKWEIAAGVHLTNMSRNRRAWLGQAAGCFFCGAPEYLVKIVWWSLNDKQRDKANLIAEQVIRKWEISQIQKGQYFLNLKHA